MYKFLFKIIGWKIDENIPKEYKRCVLIGAPHTSNWDLFYVLFLFKILKVPYKFTIKKEWFRFPFNLIIKPLGGLPIDTKNKGKSGNIKKMADLFKNNDDQIIPFNTLNNGKKWHVLFYGLYENRDAAIAAIEKLPTEAKLVSPWPRTIGSIKID